MNINEDKINSVLNQIGDAIQQVVSQVTKAVTVTGEVVAKSYELDAFNQVKVGSTFDVTIKKGDQKVVIHANESLFDNIKATVDNQTLNLGLDAIKLGGHATLKAEIYMPELSAISVNGVASVAVQDMTFTPEARVEVTGASSLESEIKCETLQVNVSGTSKAKLDVDVHTLKSHVSGASNLNLEGNVQVADIKATGSSSIKAKELTTEEAEVQAEGVSSVAVLVKGQAKAKANGASSIGVYGPGELVSSQSNGASSVSKK